jgi:hypothetical protein
VGTRKLFPKFVGLFLLSKWLAHQQLNCNSQ